MRALDMAASTPWAILPEALEQIVDIASRSHEPDFLAAATRLAERQAEINGTQTDAVSVLTGDPYGGSRTARKRGSTAILAVEGPIMRYATLFGDISGATSVQALARDLNTAINDPQVKSILMHVDSPGGEVNGIGEFADMVKAARGVKPITAYVSHQGCSAAYWIASAADRIVVAPTAAVGSIGVVLSIADPKKARDSRVEIVSAQSPMKRPSLDTREGRAQVESLADEIATLFIDAVAQNRGVSVETVLSDFGQGGIMLGQKAVDAGMADAVGSFEQALVDLQEGNPAGSTDDPAPLNPAPAAKPLAAPATKSPVRRRVQTMGSIKDFKDRVTRILSASASAEEDPEVTAEAIATLAASAAAEAEAQVRREVTAAVTTPAVVGLTDEQRELAAERHRSNELAAENRRLVAERINDRANAWADSVIQTSKRAYMAEKDSMVAAYVQAAMDDASFKAVQNPDGSTGTRVALLEAAYASRPQHMLDEETVKQGVHAMGAYASLFTQQASNTPSKPGEGVSEERRKALLGHTSQGRELLNGAAQK